MSTLACFSFLALSTLWCSAQYYPSPKPVPATKEASLTRDLQGIPDNLKKIDLLLSLANIYYYKPERKPAFIDKSISLASSALKISEKLKNREKFNQSQYLIALCYIWEDNFKAAEAVLPLLDESTKNNLLVSIGFKALDVSHGKDDPNLITAEKMLERARVSSVQLKNKKNELTARHYLIMVNYMKDATVDPVKKLDEIIAEYKSSKVVGVQYVYQSLAGIYNDRSLADKSLYYIRQAIKEMHASGDLNPAGDFYNGLGLIFKQEKENDKEMEAKMTALSYYKTTPALGNIIGSINSVMMAYINQRKYQQAIDFLNKSLKEYSPNTLDEQMSVTSAYANAYLGLKQYALAEKYFLKRFKMNLEIAGPSFGSYDRMGYFYIESRQFTKARPYLEEAFRLKGPRTSPNALASLQYRLYLVDSAAGNYLSAIKHLNINHSYNDTIAKAKKNGEISKLLVQYEDDKKQSQIRSLKQQSQLDLANIKRASLIQNVSIAGTILVLIAGGIFYRQSIIRKKLNKEILAKNRRQEVLLSRLNRLLSEKQWLLKEVHHRVKNNLHTIISLLNIQAEFLKDDALLAIENSQHRIHAMSLIHQKLYASDDVQTIDMVEYIKELLNYLKSSFGEGDNIKYISRVDPLFLDVGQAMPLGLIINEAVTNSIKYAFPNDEKGTISIFMEKNDRMVTLTIADDGIGMPESAKNAKINSLGLKLIEGLSGDINATLKIESDQGTKLMIIFDPEYLNSLTVMEEEEIA